MFDDPRRMTVKGWLTATFPFRGELRSEIAAELRRCRPVANIDAPDKSFLGRVVEHAIGLQLCDRPPYARLLDCLPAPHASRLLDMVGYAAAPDAPADHASWQRRPDRVHPSRWFTAASRLAHVDWLLHELEDRRGDARLLLERQSRRLCVRVDLLATRPAFGPLWCSYTKGFDTGLRSYGPATARPALYGGRRHADFLLGTTVLEVKSGRLDHDVYLDELVRHLLEYVLLASCDGHVITHLAAYAVRYERLLRYPMQETLDRLAGRRLDALLAGKELQRVIDGTLVQ